MPESSTQNRISPKTLAALLGQPSPTPQQAAVTGAGPGPLLVVAGAGAGKTATMAARVVWLVANGLAEPDQVLGLTFTRKAAQQLGHKIRGQLAELAGSPRLREVDPSGRLADRLADAAPTASTYDSFAGSIIREFGLLLPVEPTARIIGKTELFTIASQLVEDYTGVLETTVSTGEVVERVLALNAEMDNHQADPEDVADEARAFIANVTDLPKAPRQRDALNKDMQKWVDAQRMRIDLLPLVTALRAELRERSLTTFPQQMSQAARLAATRPKVRAALRRRYRVVMLDEYQDTSHSQRVLLRSLFGADPAAEPAQAPVPVTGPADAPVAGPDATAPDASSPAPAPQAPALTVDAVGDPMQAIYGWRGATAANLLAFREDFPEGTRPAPKAELTVSFRNPARVLAAANAVSDSVLGSAEATERPVAPLEPFGDEPGGVSLGWYETIAEERAAVAEKLAAHYRAAADASERFTGAVLVRKNAQAAPIAAELEARGVPVEIVGVGGLLDVPEVADVVAVATMLVRPEDNAAALRVLSGPMVGLSVKDLQALDGRARQLARRSRPAPAGEESTETAGTPDVTGTSDAGGTGTSDVAAAATGDSTTPASSAAWADLLAEIDEALPPDAEQVVGLADAVADLGEGAGLSEEGARRLARLSATLRALRTRSLGKPLPELFADIESATGVRTEALAREDPGADGAPGTAHLDRLGAEVAAFAAVPGATLPRLLDYFRLARDHEAGLAPGEVSVRADRVQILTVHKAKGLEWRHVAVVHADDRTWKATPETFLTRPHTLPPELRGDADETVQFAPDAENRKEFETGAKAFIEEVRATEAQEATRLFYVAVTRAERTLTVTGSALNDTASRPAAAYGMLELLAGHAPDAVETWFDPAAEPAGDTDGTAADTDGAAAATGDAAAAQAAANRTTATQEATPGDGTSASEAPALFPAVDADAAVRAGAEQVRAARGELPAAADDELSTQWEADATALIEERRALDAPDVEVELSGRLTASDLVNLGRDPDAFARRQRRPVPFKPNSYAKRGTAFHSWLEERFGGQSLIDEDQLPGLGEEEVAPAELAHLKERFLESAWAERTPQLVEHPFELAVGGSVVRGRMDAVFRDPEGGWIIVDWKTGAPPRGADLRAAAVQLAVYREAFRELLAARGRGDEPVRAAFHYVAAGYTLEPADLPGRAELEALLDVD
ncbi:hypothetical protein CFRA_03120 [Corynebacterium frankenforstense DSM 45800]|uniref:DNA 3'-5' helicase n=1 Tax=Corynebacterium frankenforstense DSM 45800 TaxID=1437875 RepID=A0A1L7CRF4_9CORY|nr:UvrD-helicase domain-containing protein [Corynebacterium frankenforstense]APT88435.1 hypothetical protein CFRA_03120 [Corynebacterium frankenforstense DSM 45800]